MSISPFKRLRGTIFDLDRQIDDTFSQLIGARWGRAAADWEPAVDLYETETTYIFEADLPGVRPEDVKIEIDARTVTICGTRQSTHHVQSARGIRIERRHGRFCRVFVLDHAIDASAMRMTQEDGIFYVQIPKHPGERGM